MSFQIARSSLSAAVMMLSLCGFASAADTVRVADRAQFVRALGAARPGTTILIAPGTYQGGLSRAGLRGTEAEPIVIAAADPKNPPEIRMGGSGLHFSGAEHLELRDLVISRAEGNGLNIDDGGNRDAPAKHITIRGVTIRDVGPRGNRDGMKLSGVSDFTIENCTIERWGDSGSAIDMVGCHRGRVVGCTFRYRGDLAANGVQAKGGSSEIAISRCRFENAGGRGVNIGGSTGLDYFRPRPQGYEAKDITVEDCTFVGSMSPIAFVGVDGAVVRYNTIYRPTRWGIRILQENQMPEFSPCRNGRFERNLVVFRADEVGMMVNIGGKTAPDTFSFAGNVWVCLDRPRDARRVVSLPGTQTDSQFPANVEFQDADRGDFRLKPGESLDAGVRPEEAAP